MKIQQHGPHLWQLTWLTAFNCFLVQEADGLTLIDAGLPNSIGGILKTARKIGQPITRVALTHAHGDHVGSLDQIYVRLPEVELAMSPRTAAFLRGEMDLLPDEPQAPLKGSFMRRQAKPGRLLIAGEKFGSLRVLAAPGHSPDQVAYFDERDGTLIAGDAWQTIGGLAVAGVRRWLFPFPAAATWHLPTAVATARALRDANPGRLAVGHGAVLEKPGPAIDRSIAEAAALVDG